MDIRKIKKLIELIERSSISELEISEEKKTIRISRSVPHTSTSPLLFPIKQESNTVTSAHITNNKEYCNTSNATINEYTICSPMVGIFYRAAHPNDKPFISIGQSVEIGDTLCIVEAMKVMNQIQSDKSGTIKSILVDDGQPVEFGEPLLIIK